MGAMRFTVSAPAPVAYMISTRLMEVVVTVVETFASSFRFHRMSRK